MQIARITVLSLSLSVMAFAQIRGGYGGFGGGGLRGSSGHPSILYPGTGAPSHPIVAPIRPPGIGAPVRPPFGANPPIYRPPGAITDPSFGQRLGWTVRGQYPYPGYGYGYGYGYGGRAYPVIVPVWGGGFSQDPTVIIQQPYMQPYPPQQTPVVIINQGFQPETANPVVRDYSNSNLPEPTLKSYEATSKPYEDLEPKAAPAARRAAKDDEPTLYLVALKDGNIQPVLSFWREGETLHYVSMKRTINRISLSLVDKDLSKRLNNERGLEFDLNE